VFTACDETPMPEENEETCALVYKEKQCIDVTVSTIYDRGGVCDIFENKKTNEFEIKCAALSGDVEVIRCPEFVLLQTLGNENKILYTKTKNAWIGEDGISITCDLIVDEGTSFKNSGDMQIIEAPKTTQNSNLRWLIEKQNAYDCSADVCHTDYISDRLIQDCAIRSEIEKFTELEHCCTSCMVGAEADKDLFDYLHYQNTKYFENRGVPSWCDMKYAKMVCWNMAASYCEKIALYNDDNPAAKRLCCNLCNEGSLKGATCGLYDTKNTSCDVLFPVESFKY